MNVVQIVMLQSKSIAAFSFLMTTAFVFALTTLIWNKTQGRKSERAANSRRAGDMRQGNNCQGIDIKMEAVLFQMCCWLPHCEDHQWEVWEGKPVTSGDH